jgi:SAM-dependent methyltransferase
VPGDNGVVPPCPACAGRPLHRRYQLAYGAIWECPACCSAVTRFADPDALRRANARWGDADTARWRALAEATERRHAQSRLRALRRWQPHGGLLEIGPNRGEFLAAAADAGFDISATDLFDVLAAATRRRCAAVYPGDFLDCAIDQRFDAIAAFHVLEHVVDPRRFLQKCRDLLKPGGVLSIEVPNYDSLDRLLSGARWDMLFEYHVSHFSRRGLVALVESAGLSVCQLSSVTDPSRYLAGPYFRLRVAAWNALKQALRRPDGARRPKPELVTAGAAGDRVVKTIVQTEWMALRLLSIPLMPLAALQAGLGRGQVTRVIVRRS